MGAVAFRRKDHGDAEERRRRRERYFYTGAIRLLHYNLSRKEPDSLEEARRLMRFEASARGVKDQPSLQMFVNSNAALWYSLLVSVADAELALWAEERVWSMLRLQRAFEPEIVEEFWLRKSIQAQPVQGRLDL